MLTKAWEVRFLLHYALVPAIIGQLTTKSMGEMADVGIGHLAYAHNMRQVREWLKIDGRITPY